MQRQASEETAEAAAGLDPDRNKRPPLDCQREMPVKLNLNPAPSVKRPEKKKNPCAAPLDVAIAVLSGVLEELIVEERVVEVGLGRSGAPRYGLRPPPRELLLLQERQEKIHHLRGEEGREWVEAAQRPFVIWRAIGDSHVVGA